MSQAVLVLYRTFLALLSGVPLLGITEAIRYETFGPVEDMLSE